MVTLIATVTALQMAASIIILCMPNEDSDMVF